MTSKDKEELAIANIEQFIKDCGIEGVRYMRVAQDDWGDLYAFLLWKEQRFHQVLMPGVQLKKVRYIKESQNITRFKRLLVDGGQWAWKFALLNTEDDWSLNNHP